MCGYQVRSTEAKCLRNADSLARAHLRDQSPSRHMTAGSKPLKSESGAVLTTPVTFRILSGVLRPPHYRSDHTWRPGKPLPCLHPLHLVPHSGFFDRRPLVLFWISSTRSTSLLRSPNPCTYPKLTLLTLALALARGLSFPSLNCPSIASPGVWPRFGTSKNTHNF